MVTACFFLWDSCVSFGDSSLVRREFVKLVLVFVGLLAFMIAVITSRQGIPKCPFGDMARQPSIRLK